jgi:hypothetical protein
VVLAALLMAAPMMAAPGAAQEAPVAELSACIAALGDDEDGAEEDLLWPELVDACPDLEAALAASEYAPWLPEAWRERAQESPGFITLDSLIALERLLDAESAPRDARTVSQESLAAALDDLDRAEAKPRVTWWNRLLEWLRERMSRQRGDEDAGWLIEWLSDLGRHETLLRMLGYGLFAAIVLVALGIVVNEMKIAGVFDARRRRDTESAAADAPSIAHVPATPSTERFAALIDRILAALTADERVSVDAAATHRELVRSVRLHDSDEHASFVRLVDCAERVRYAPAWPPEGEIESALDGGNALLTAIHRRRGVSQ